MKRNRSADPPLCLRPCFVFQASQLVALNTTCADLTAMVERVSERVGTLELGHADLVAVLRDCQAGMQRCVGDSGGGRGGGGYLYVGVRWDRKEGRVSD